MSALEVNLKKQNLLPRVWLRYVDDDKILAILNTQFDSINFTYETKKDGNLPFLDLQAQKIGFGIEFAVYHKPTITMRTITNDSHCPIQHKLAAYHPMIHRLCRLPLNNANYSNEFIYIK